MWRASGGCLCGSATFCHPWSVWVGQFGCGRGVWSWTYDVIHERASVEKNADIVAPFDVVDAGAISGHVCAVVHLPVCANQAHAGRPVVHLLSPLRVCLVAGEVGQARCQFEELPIRQAVLVVVAVVEGEDLPPQSPAACCVVPAGDLLVEDGLRDGEVGRGVGGGRECSFCCCEGCMRPCGLVVIALVYVRTDHRYTH
jgi:hypothetical protein